MTFSSNSQGVNRKLAGHMAGLTKQQEQEVGTKARKPQFCFHIDSLPPARLCPIKVQQPSQTVPPAEN